MSLTKVSYSMIDGAYINVLDYGAFNDGSNGAATTAAIQAACDADLGPVFLPAGTYAITSTIELKRNNIQFIGSGWDTVLNYTGVNRAITAIGFEQGVIGGFVLNGTIASSGGVQVSSVAGSVNTTRFYDIRIQGFTATSAVGFSVEPLGATAVVHTTMSNVVSKGNYIGFQCTGDVTTLEAHNCIFKENSNRGAVISGSRGGNFYNCSFEANGGAGLVVTTANASNNAFYNCWIEANNTAAIDGTNSVILSVSTFDNTFYNLYHKYSIVNLDGAVNCSLLYPNFNSLSDFKAGAGTNFCTVLTDKLLDNSTGVVGNTYQGLKIQTSFSPSGALNVNSATPWVNGGLSSYSFSNTTPITITDFLGGFDGQTMVIWFVNDGTTTTINSNANFDLTATVSSATNRNITLQQVFGKWYEVSRA